jgi:hypothetical protein
MYQQKQLYRESNIVMQIFKPNWKSKERSSQKTLHHSNCSLAKTASGRASSVQLSSHTTPDAPLPL